MRYITVFVSIFLLLFSEMLFAQQNEISVMLNGKIIGKSVIENDSSVNLNISRQSYDTATEMELVLNKKPNHVYKTTLQITNAKEEQLCLANESLSRPGTYPVNLSLLHNKSSDVEIIKVFLLQNPANKMMSLPSRRTLVAELYIK